MCHLKPYFYAIIVLLAFPAVLMADYISISGSGNSFMLQSGEIGILSGNDHQFSMDELDILAATLQNDGIDTVGKISFMLASTDAGLSFIGLFDGVPTNNPNGSTPDHYLGLSTTTTVGSDWYATGDAGTESEWYNLGNNTQMLNSIFAWDHQQTSAAFAWGDVNASPSGTFNLYDVDLTEFGSESIQFLTYTDSHWDVAGVSSFSVLGQYAFSYQFVPAPGAIALLALAGLTNHRIRRRKQ